MNKTPSLHLLENKETKPLLLWNQTSFKTNRNKPNLLLNQAKTCSKLPEITLPLLNQTKSPSNLRSPCLTSALITSTEFPPRSWSNCDSKSRRVWSRQRQTSLTKRGSNGDLSSNRRQTYFKLMESNHKQKNTHPIHTVWEKKACLYTFSNVFPLVQKSFNFPIGQKSQITSTTSPFKNQSPLAHKEPCPKPATSPVVSLWFL